MNNKLLTILALFVGMAYAGNASAQFGWGTTAAKPRAETVKAADQTMNTPADTMNMAPTADSAAPDMAVPAAPEATPAATVPAAPIDNGMKSHNGMMPKAEMPVMNGDKADMAAPAAATTPQ